MNQFVKNVRYYLNRIALGFGYLILASAIVVASLIGYHEYSEVVRKEKFHLKHNPCGEGWRYGNVSEITLEKIKRCMPKEKSITRLVAAISLNDLELTKLLVSRGFDVNGESVYGGNPLRATQLFAGDTDAKRLSDKLEMMIFLLESGANVNSVTPTKQTVLMAVVFQRRHREFIDLLYSYGADPHMVDEDGNTALHLAAESPAQGSVEIFQALVDIGSDIEVANNSGKTAYTLFQDRKDEWTFGDESFHAIVQILSKGSSTPVIGNKEPYIHPECLDFLSPWSKGYTESFDCSGLDLSKVETQGDEFGVRYGEGQSIAYKHADIDLELPLGIALLEVGIDGGGSGLFSSIALLYKDEKKPNIYEVLIDTPSGDRCNDGNKWVSKASPGGFEFKSAATPFRLLNPDDTTDWRNWYLAKALMDEAGEELDRPAVFNEWEPYEDVTNSANACFGWIVRKFDYETGFKIIGVELEKGFEPRPEDGSLEGCINNWLVREAGKKGLFVDKDEWVSGLDGLKLLCKSDSDK